MSLPATNSDEHRLTPAVIPKAPRELAELSELPFVDLRAECVQTDAAAAIPLHVLVRIRAIPYRLEGGRLKIAVSDPSNLLLTDELRAVAVPPLLRFRRARKRC
jgi:hypothetical protein